MYCGLGRKGRGLRRQCRTGKAIVETKVINSECMHLDDGCHKGAEAAQQAVYIGAIIGK